MNTFDLKIIRILLATSTMGFVLFYLFPVLLIFPCLILLGIGLRWKSEKVLAE